MKNNYIKAVIFYTILTLFSCNAQTKEDNVSKNNGLLGNSNLTLKSINIDSIILNNAQLWKESWNNFDSFKLKSVNKAVLNEKSSTSIDLEQYFDFLVYSPDDSLIIDIYSYNMDLIITDEDTLATFDIDSEASLINVKTGDRYKILFFGSAGGFDDAFWISNNEFIIVGYQEIFNEYDDNYNYIPMVWYYNLIEKKIGIFEGTTNKMINSNYFTLRHPEIKIE